nr:glutamate receptor 1.2-like [Ziziphus jujuba var. spinosa]
MVTSLQNSAIFFLLTAFGLFGHCVAHDLSNIISHEDEVHVGVIRDMGSKEGKIVYSCISMAVSDFYEMHNYYTTRLHLHARDSKGKPLHALSAAFDLLDNVKVEAIIGAQTRKEAKFLAELGDKEEVPVISLSEPSFYLHSNKYPFFIQITQDVETCQFKSISDMVNTFKWRDIILIYEDTDFIRDIIPYMVDSFHENDINVTYKSAISNSYTDDNVVEELYKLMDFQTKVFVVHMSEAPVSKLLINAKRLGMMSEGYAWFVTASTMNLLSSVDSSVIDSMQGLVGFKSYIPATKDLQNLALRLRRKFSIELSVYGIWAYDSIWAVAEAVERFINGKLTSNLFEVVNVKSKEKTRWVGFWNYSTEEANRRRHISSAHDLEEPIIWPGGSLTGPRVFSGFCIEAFILAIRKLPYPVEVEFIPYGGTYNDLVYQVYLGNFDGAVGDISITWERSLYVEFTISHTNTGSIATVVPNQSSRRNMWIFLRPLAADLWITTTGFFILTGFVVWIIEHPINQEFQGSSSQQIGTVLWFIFSTLVFAHREKLLNSLSKFVVIVWVFVVLILTNSYTAILTSMMTVQQIQLNPKENYLGYQMDSPIQASIFSLNFEGFKPYSSLEEYAEALSKGSKHGGVSAIVDEVPCIKQFVAKYPGDYSVKTMPMSNMNGFGYTFQKGSTLVQDISKELSKLKEARELAVLEKKWISSRAYSEEALLTPFDDSGNGPEVLSLD